MRGQYFSFDAIVASVIFVLALVALLSYWHSVKNYLDYQGASLSKDSVRISNQLLSVSGSSANCQDLESLGFALSVDDRRLNASTMECALKKGQGNQDWLKQKLGTPYNVSINVTELSDSSNSQKPIVFSIGGNLPDAPNEVVKIRRVVSIYNDSKGVKKTYLAWMEVALYR
ncbi:hypothetical protein HY988_00695 [Candidatus Micrarchaeota archaeon]|nr:hypothetical protein [Candidatus Micrarchaeota archaeon]